MPVIKVDMWEGRDKETKEKIIKGITKVFTNLGVPESAVVVILNEIPKDNWGVAGEQASKKA
ncbi:MAG: 4-oxalocrotonate tautomerase family protein [Candidatus Altiarchaeota archaeon]